MKVIALCVLAFIALSSAKPQKYSRGCRFILDRCISECEEGTHAYSTGCDFKTPEATCEEPNPQPEEFMICDYSACHCDKPTVRNSVSGKCVARDECPKKSLRAS